MLEEVWRKFPRRVPPHDAGDLTRKQVHHKDEETTAADLKGKPPQLKHVPAFSVPFVGFLDRAVRTRGGGRKGLSREEQKGMMKRGNRTHEGVFPPFPPARPAQRLI